MSTQLKRRIVPSMLTAVVALMASSCAAANTSTNTQTSEDTGLFITAIFLVLLLIGLVGSMAWASRGEDRRKAKRRFSFNADLFDAFTRRVNAFAPVEKELDYLKSLNDEDTVTVATELESVLTARMETAGEYVNQLNAIFAPTDTAPRRVNSKQTRQNIALAENRVQIVRVTLCDIRRLYKRALEAENDTPEILTASAHTLKSIRYRLVEIASLGFDTHSLTERFKHAQQMHEAYLQLPHTLQMYGNLCAFEDTLDELHEDTEEVCDMSYACRNRHHKITDQIRQAQLSILTAQGDLERIKAEHPESEADIPTELMRTAEQDVETARLLQQEADQAYANGDLAANKLYKKAIRKAKHARYCAEEITAHKVRLHSLKEGSAPTLENAIHLFTDACSLKDRDGTEMPESVRQDIELVRSRIRIAEAELAKTMPDHFKVHILARSIIARARTIKRALTPQATLEG